MPPETDSTGVASEVSRLSLQSSAHKAPAKPGKLKTTEVADSWEDEDVSSGSDEEATSQESRPPSAAQDGTAAPPPTPLSPSHNKSIPFSPLATPASPNAYAEPSSGPAARPEKTDAVARRMIASALGVKVPRLTEEQKAYDRAVREKERKRREEEKAAERQRQLEAAKAKTAVWED